MEQDLQYASLKQAEVKAREIMDRVRKLGSMVKPLEMYAQSETRALTKSLFSATKDLGKKQKNFVRGVQQEVKDAQQALSDAEWEDARNVKNVQTALGKKVERAKSSLMARVQTLAPRLDAAMEHIRDLKASAEAQAGRLREKVADAQQTAARTITATESQVEEFVDSVHKESGALGTQMRQQSTSQMQRAQGASAPILDRVKKDAERTVETSVAAMNGMAKKHGRETTVLLAKGQADLRQ